jgi:inner membrane transporter RhtA
VKPRQGLVNDRTRAPDPAFPGLLGRVPPVSFFLVSAVFHYLGPSLAVLLFARVSVLGVAWLRVVTAAVVFAVWRRPWRLIARLTGTQRFILAALGVVLALMNAVFYLAVDRLPLATVSSIEFLGTVILAAAGTRTKRNLAALVITIGGVALLTEVHLAAQLTGYAFAFANCAGFMLYVILAHRIATTAASSPAAGPGGGPLAGVDQLGAAMLIAALVITPIGAGAAAAAFASPVLLAAGAGVGICSSVIPYVTDQLAMARLPRATFALMLALLPAAATLIGLIVLRQVPSARDLAGIGLVIAGIATHHGPSPPPSAPAGSASAGRGTGVQTAWHAEVARDRGDC